MLYYEDLQEEEDFHYEYETKMERNLSYRHYELTNHLGNVLAVVSDRKIAVEDQGNPGTVEYYEADVVSAQDYYPFGMIQPGRSVSAGEYRYGFNSMEQDDEWSVTGGHLDFGARIYDARLGRFLSLDPLMKKYPGLSDYAFTANSPIMFMDFDGRDFRYSVNLSGSRGRIEVQSTIHLYGADAHLADAMTDGKYSQSGFVQVEYFDHMTGSNVSKPVLVQVNVEFVVHETEEQAYAAMQPGDNVMLVDRGLDNEQVADLGSGPRKPADDLVAGRAQLGGIRANLRNLTTTTNVLHEALHLLGFMDRYTRDEETKLPRDHTGFSGTLMAGENPEKNSQNLHQINFNDLVNTIMDDSEGPARSWRTTSGTYEGPLDETPSSVK